ncbi:Hypothetical predicted protein [Octopus vulgaris]|uniref:Uncharacterized protein n=1 Tax=Octopus vulgaris TaxID=6645 RepID=A0AA36BQP0_OCTVU|nr:Hypothetical predicted protein [Octopus vulgaris]
MILPWLIAIHNVTNYSGAVKEQLHVQIDVVIGEFSQPFYVALANIFSSRRFHTMEEIEQNSLQLLSMFRKSFNTNKMRAAM